MDNYPDARHFYMNRSWNRRKEFRRRQKKFALQIKKKIDIFIDRSEHFYTMSGSDENDSNSKNEVHDYDSDYGRLIREKKELDKINNCKKFFYEINFEEELNNDIDSDELELLSDDEI
jgi:hypothetical protein